MEQNISDNTAQTEQAPPHEDPNFKMVMTAGLLFIILLGIFTWLFNTPFN